MKEIARFVTRPSKNGCDSPNLGIIFFNKNNKEIKANRVYEIAEISGELVIKDIGPCILGMTVSESVDGVEACWGNCISHILNVCQKFLILTKREYGSYRNR